MASYTLAADLKNVYGRFLLKYLVKQDKADFRQEAGRVKRKTESQTKCQNQRGDKNSTCATADSVQELIIDTHRHKHRRTHAPVYTQLENILSNVPSLKINLLTLVVLQHHYRTSNF